LPSLGKCCWYLWVEVRDAAENLKMHQDSPFSDKKRNMQPKISIALRLIKVPETLQLIVKRIQDPEKLSGRPWCHINY
jgi:hypothetical protein